MGEKIGPYDARTMRDIYTSATSPRFLRSGNKAVSPSPRTPSREQQASEPRTPPTALLPKLRKHEKKHSLFHWLPRPMTFLYSRRNYSHGWKFLTGIESNNHSETRTESKFIENLILIASLKNCEFSQDFGHKDFANKMKERFKKEDDFCIEQVEHECYFTAVLQLIYACRNRLVLHEYIKSVLACMTPLRGNIVDKNDVNYLNPSIQETLYNWLSTYNRMDTSRDKPELNTGNSSKLLRSLVELKYINANVSEHLFKPPKKFSSSGEIEKDTIVNFINKLPTEKVIGGVLHMEPGLRDDWSHWLAFTLNNGELTWYDTSKPQKFYDFTSDNVNQLKENIFDTYENRNVNLSNEENPCITREITLLCEP